METLQENKGLNKIESGDHICLLFDSINNYREVATNYIIQGLVNKEKVVAITNEYSISMLCEDLKEKGIDTEYHIKKEQLVIKSINDIYFNNNKFNPSETINYWKKMLREIKKQNFSGFRVIGEMLFNFNSTQMNFDKVMEYELLFNKEIWPLYNKYTYLCVFNKTKFPIVVLEDIIKKT